MQYVLCYAYDLSCFFKWDVSSGVFLWMLFVNDLGVFRLVLVPSSDLSGKRIFGWYICIGTLLKDLTPDWHIIVCITFPALKWLDPNRIIGLLSHPNLRMWRKLVKYRINSHQYYHLKLSHLRKFPCPTHHINKRPTSSRMTFNSHFRQLKLPRRL